MNEVKIEEKITHTIVVPDPPREFTGIKDGSSIGHQKTKVISVRDLSKEILQQIGTNWTEKLLKLHEDMQDKIASGETII